MKIDCFILREKDAGLIRITMTEDPAQETINHKWIMGKRRRQSSIIIGREIW